MIEQIRHYLLDQEESFLADLAALVNLDCGTYNKAGVDQAGAVMTAVLEASGMHVERLPLTQYGDCLLGRVRGSGTGSVLLVGHLDTVYPDGTAATRPLRIEGDKVVGPGTCDMKGGLLAGAYAVRALRAAGFDSFGEIVFFVNSEEEVGSPEARTLYAPYAQAADAALVLEAGRASGAIVSARKGSGTYTVQVAGRSAHAGVAPDRGANAVLQLAHLTQALHALNGMRRGLTVNVGTVTGGTRPNVVPDAAEAQVDVRVISSDDIEPLDAAIRTALAVQHVTGTTSSLRGGIEMPPMEKTASTGRLADMAREAAASLGFGVEDVATGGASDANHIAALGTPVLDGLGPIGQMAHSPDEYLDRTSIVPRTALLALLIATIVERRSELARA